MRVLALVTDAFGGNGGIAQYNRDFLTALSKSDRISAITALPRFGSPSKALPARITQLPSSQNRIVWSVQAMKQALALRPDVIFCGHLNAAPLAAAIGQAVSRPVWLQVHGIEAWSERNSLTRRAIEASSLITSVSRYTRHRLLSWCSIAPERVRVLSNTVHLANSDYQPRVRGEDLVSRHKLKGRKVILTVGRMAAAERYKGHDRIIRCLPKLLQTVPAAVYLVVGTGDDRPRLEALARDLGMADLVRFTGKVEADELPNYYALADVFAMPSTGEGFGIVFLEAAAHGLPVIGGNRDGSVDALADGTVGRAIDPDDPGALTAALSEALLGTERGSRAAVDRFAFANFTCHANYLVQSLDH